MIKTGTTHFKGASVSERPEDSGSNEQKQGSYQLHKHILKHEGRKEEKAFIS